VTDQATGTDPSVRTTDVAAGWDTIGGVPNGAYLLAEALRVAAEGFDGAVPLTVTGHYLRPGAVGPAEVTTEVVRRGQRTSTAAIRLEQAGKERVRALVTFGDPAVHTGVVAFAPSAPVVPPPDECVAPSHAMALALHASMVQRFEYRVAPPARWLGGTAERAGLDAWIRLADGQDADLYALVLFADAFPAAVLEVADGMAPTIELTVHLRRQPAPGWIQARTGSRMLAGGLVEQDVELWDSRGDLVAMSRQLMTFTELDLGTAPRRSATPA
jgi:acyl-CoA thioesterase